MTMFRAFILSVFLLQAGFTRPVPVIERAPIERFLNQFNASSLPHVNLVDISSSEILDVKLDPRIHHVLSELNNYLFKTQLFRARACRHCLLVANLGTFEIFVQPSLIHAIEERAASPEEFQLQLRFVLAHELAHYLYELATRSRLATEGVELSPNGNPSFRQMMASLQNDDLSFVRAHAEVDVMAVVVLERMGLKGARAAAISLLRSLAFRRDGPFRIQTLERLK